MRHEGCAAHPTFWLAHCQGVADIGIRGRHLQDLRCRRGKSRMISFDLDRDLPDVAFLTDPSFGPRHPASVQPWRAVAKRRMPRKGQFLHRRKDAKCTIRLRVRRCQRERCLRKVRAGSEVLRGPVAQTRPLQDHGQLILCQVSAVPVIRHTG